MTTIFETSYKTEADSEPDTESELERIQEELRKIYIELDHLANHANFWSRERITNVVRQLSNRIYNLT